MLRVRHRSEREYSYPSVTSQSIGLPNDARQLPGWIRWRKCSDLLLQINERLLAYLEESVARSIEIHHEGDNRTKEGNQHDGSEGLRRWIKPTL